MDFVETIGQYEHEPIGFINRMPFGGSLTLADVAEHVAVLAVACSRCDRAGRYPLDRLIEHHGRSFTVPDLLRLLAVDCLKRNSVSAYDLCGVHCPELPRLFLKLE